MSYVHEANCGCGFKVNYTLSKGIEAVEKQLVTVPNHKAHPCKRNWSLTHIKNSSKKIEKVSLSVTYGVDTFVFWRGNVKTNTLTCEGNFTTSLSHSATTVNLIVSIPCLASSFPVTSLWFAIVSWYPFQQFRIQVSNREQAPPAKVGKWSGTENKMLLRYRVSLYRRGKLQLRQPSL